MTGKLDFITPEWIKAYCDVEIKSATERWERDGRPKNDAWINGSHSGFTHALQNLKQLIETLERLEGGKKV